MKYIDIDDSLKNKIDEMRKHIRKSYEFEKVKKLFLEIHAALHVSEVSGNKKPNEIDALFEDLQLHEFKTVPSPKDETIAWAVWHLARIEDMTMNILVNQGEQIFNKKWQERLNAPFTDTGVAMSGDEIIKLSNELNTAELLVYRNTVGKRTREIVTGLVADDMKRKVSPEGLNKIRSEGGTCANSEWLLEYWGKKDVAGILLMPPTRHLMMHLNDCMKWKQRMRTENKIFNNT
ncbi:MAG: DinB family protein [Oscillospiraceae bacterium]|nr:DinB family protein [Oscillospiraceae bacterium]